MGYFSNGTEGMIYESRYCERCGHYGDEEEGCPVWLIHIIYNYEDKSDIGTILNLLIPQNKEAGNKQCSLFIQSKEDRETGKLF